MGTARQGLRDFSRPRPGITLSLSRPLPARTAWTYLRSQCKQSTGPSGPFWNVLVYSVDDESSCQRSHTDEFSVFFFPFFFPSSGASRSARARQERGNRRDFEPCSFSHHCDAKLRFRPCLLFFFSGRIWHCEK